MVEPLSIIAAFCSIIRSLYALYRWWQHNPAMQKELMGGFMRIWSRYNRIASIMGRGFQLNFNETLMKDLKLLGPKVKILQLQQKELESTKIDQAQDPKGQYQTRKKITWLAKCMRDIQDEAEDALRKLSTGIIPADKDVEAMENEQLKAKYPLRPFCDGAKIFQSGDKDDDYLTALATAAPSRTGWGYICNSCGLEVGYYPAVRISRDGKALDSSILLTASHLVACRSIQNRRAFYRCLACYKKHKVVDFPSAVAFEKHMEQHLNFTLIKKQDVDWKENQMMEKEREFMDGIGATEYEPEETFAEDVSHKVSGTHQDSEPVDLLHRLNSPNMDRRAGRQAKDIRSDTLSPKEEDHRPVHSKAEYPITPLKIVRSDPHGPQNPQEIDTEFKGAAGQRRSPQKEVKFENVSTLMSFASSETSTIHKAGGNPKPRESAPGPGNASGEEVESRIAQEGRRTEMQRANPSYNSRELAVESATVALGLRTVKQASEPRPGVMSPADTPARYMAPTTLQRPTESRGSNANAAPQEQPSPGTVSQSQPLGPINTTIMQPARSPIPNPNIAIEPDYWALRDGEYHGYGYVNGRRTVLKVQMEAPLDSWILSDHGWPGHPGEKFMSINSQTGVAEYHPGGHG